MKVYKTIHHTSVLCVVLGMLMLYTLPISAQSQTNKQAASSSNQKQTGSESNNKQMDASNTENKMMDSPISDDMFVQTISESNLAEIELSTMALEKASSEKVKEYAQMLIKHHTSAQLELSSAITQSMAMQATRNSTAGTGNDANDDPNTESPHSDAAKTATLGGTGGTTGNTTANGKTNGQYNSRIDSGKAASQAGTATNSARNTSTSVSNNANSTTGAANQKPVAQKRYFATEISTEHKALKNKLSVLSGAAFDSQYLQAMVEDHAKAVELYEKQALQSTDTYLQAFASKNLPVIKDHYQKAQQLYTDSSTSQKEK